MKARIIAIVGLLSLGVFGCRAVVTSLLPPAPAYPAANEAQLTAEARQWSDRLERHIVAWLEGRGPAAIPNDLLPRGLDSAQVRGYRLVRWDEIPPERQWAIRPAHTIDFDSLRGAFPDPHVTYLVLGPKMLLPFGAKLVVSGQYPYARVLNLQASPPFTTLDYYYDNWAGKGEVSYVDVDIDPAPGSVNPYRAGQDRLAANRAYQVAFEMAVGRIPDLHPEFKPPHYRMRGNHRYASGIQYQGPWGTTPKFGHNRGPWTLGDLWVRYFAPDRGRGPLGGVPLSRVWYELKDGRRFYITCDYSGFIRKANTPMAMRSIGNHDPDPKRLGPLVGWVKQFGIYTSIAEGLSLALKRETPADKAYVRALDLGVTGKGERQPAPANWEFHATSCVHNNFLLRGMSIKKGMVAVLVGRLPTTPRTLNGQRELTTAQARYWSITSYDVAWPFAPIAGAAVTSVMDEEIVQDAEQRYVIVYSRPEDRPRNARPEAGVTWVNWGQTNDQSWTIRWLSVGPEWAFDKTPHELNLPWRQTTWSGSEYNPLLLPNHHRGWLGDYLPRVAYLSKAQFEALGSQVTGEKVPVWRE